MGTTQGSNVAGLFYPAERETLRLDLSRYLAQAKPYRGKQPKALVAPHAGYVYSGPIAANAYAALAQDAAQIHTVVLLAPSHRVAFGGLAVSDADTFATPLGEIPVDGARVQQLLTLPQVTVRPQAFGDEHALEVQLPFLQQVLEDFRLVPLVVGDADAQQVAEVLEQVWGDRHTLVVISSDLSHYEDYQSAQRHDARTSELIEALDEHLEYEDACGRNPLRGLLRVARRQALRAQTLDLRNSGDTAGPRDRVVGYGAYVFY
jgi:MEMO1 family protein